ncbi:MAG: hypothetical protein M1829_005468 [Trizodia sp. TS-e1964]|nr:MAG: hypothetical protein M1829_005468 [Trizodia sp. TS-e1964]
MADPLPVEGSTLTAQVKPEVKEEATSVETAVELPPYKVFENGTDPIETTPEALIDPEIELKDSISAPKALIKSENEPINTSDAPEAVATIKVESKDSQIALEAITGPETGRTHPKSDLEHIKMPKVEDEDLKVAPEALGTLDHKAADSKVAPESLETTGSKALDSKNATEASGNPTFEMKKQHAGQPKLKDGIISTSHQKVDKKVYANNVKFDPSIKEISSDPEEIRKQVEFYFSDSNLPLDRFLFSQVGGSLNKPVKIGTIHRFKRMVRFQPFEAIVDALKESKLLEVVDGDCVRRRVPIKDEAKLEVWEDRTISRSIYAKGFGDETPSTQFDIEALFAAYGPTNSIRLRRTHQKLFKGSVFVEFADDATQQAFMALEIKPKWRGQNLLIKTKKEYVLEKAAEHNYDLAKVKHTVGKDDWKRRREQDQRSGFPYPSKDNRGRNQKSFRGRAGRGGFEGRGGRGGHRGQRDPHKVPTVAVSTEDPPEENYGSDIRHEKLPTAPKAVQSSNLESTKTNDAALSTTLATGSADDNRKRHREDDDESRNGGSVKKVELEI